MSHPASRMPRSSFWGLLCLSAATLILEVGLTRVLSVSLWYHFAFMVVSTALFGFGVAGVVFSLRRQAAEVSSRMLAWGAVATPVAFVCGFWLFNLLPFEPFSAGQSAWQWCYWPLAYLLVTVPFFFSGWTISALLTKHVAEVHRLYLFDLLGAGAGSFSVVLLLPWLGGVGTLMAAAALAAIGAIGIAWEAGRRWVIAASALALVILLLVPFAEDLIPLRISRDKVAGNGVSVGQILSDPRVRLYTAWNTLSRIDVIEHQGQRSILIDAGTALTRLAHPTGDPETLGRTQDEEGFFVRMFSDPHVLVVGSGGGREVLLALRNGAARITAVEINPDINQVVSERMADFTGRLYQNPKVEAFTDEARSFIRRSSQRYQVIHCPHTISNAAMATGSLGLAESHLLTLEAFLDYLDHLSDGGVLLITHPEAHLPRLLSSLRAASSLRDRDNLVDRVMVWRQPSKGLSFYAGVALRAQSFTPEDVLAFSELLKQKKLEALYLPGLEQKPPYAQIVMSDKPKEVTLPFAAILEPATDDRPFFNQRVPLSDLGWADLWRVLSRGSDSRMALEDSPVAEVSLLLLLLQSVLLAVVFILGPLLIFRKRAHAKKARLRTLAVFFLLGLAYIVVEVGFIQKLSMYLGKPVIVFSTVLGTLLIASGLGSAYSRKFLKVQAPVLTCLLVAAVNALGALLAPVWIDATLAWPIEARTLVAILMLLPCGFLMGMPFPLLMRRLGERFPEHVPWAWGINGFASVVGSIGAVVVGMSLGYSMALWLGVIAYLLAGCGAWWLGLELRRSVHE